MSVALCTGLLTSAPRDPGDGRDTVVRPARGGLQRLDTGEAVEHAADHELIAWPSADGIDRSSARIEVGAPPNLTGDAAPDTPANTADRPRLAPDPVETNASAPSLHGHPRARSGRLPLGRAPPTL